MAFSDKNNPADEGFTLNLSFKMKYDEFARLVGEHLKYDPAKLQFFRPATYDLKTVNSQAIKYNPEFQLKDAFPAQPNKQPIRNCKLFYQKLTIKITELEERRPFKCTWISANLKVEKELSLMPFKKANVRELLADCRAELLKQDIINKQQYDDAEGFRLRFVEIVGSRLNRTIKEDVPIESMDTQIPNKSYRVEQILPDDVQNSNDEIILPVAHFSKEICATFGKFYFSFFFFFFIGQCDGL